MRADPSARVCNVSSIQPAVKLKPHTASLPTDAIPWAPRGTVRWLIGTMLAFSVALALIHLVSGKYEELRIALILAGISGAGLLVLRHSAEWAVFMVTAVGTATLWWPIVTGYGLHDIIVITYVFLAVLGALGLPRVGFVAVMSLIVLSVVGITWLEVQGVLETPIAGELEDGISILAVVLITSLFARRVAREQRRRRRELAAEHALVTGLLQASPVGIVHVDGEGRVVLANGRAREILSAVGADGEIGGRASELFSHLRALPGGPDPEVVLEAVTGARELVDQRFLTDGAEGELRWVSLNCRPIAESAGGGAVVIVEDRTKRQAALDDVEAQRTHFRALVETLSEVISVIDGGGRIAYVSPAMERVLGHRWNDRIGRDALDLVHPDDVESARAALESVRGRPASQASLRIRMKTADDRWKWVDVRLRNPEPDATVGGLVVTLRDVSPEERVKRELQQSEERFERIFRNNPIPMSLSSLEEGRVLDLNDSFLDIFGYDSDEVVGRVAENTEVWAHPEQRAEVVRRLLETDSVRGVEVTLVTRAGEHRPFLLSADRIDLGGRQCVILAGTDLTEQKELENRLLQAQKVQIVAQMTSGIAHDFKNWLTPIRGYCDLLEQSLPKESPARGYVERIVAASERAQRLVGQLLGFSRERAAESSEVDLNQLLRGLSDLGPLLSSRIELEMDLETGLAPVRARAADIEQVVMNLLLNAAEASNGQGSIRLRTRNAELGENWEQTMGAQRVSVELQPGAFVELSVSDDGSGMSEDEVERLFEPFFTTKSEQEGIGLGLFTANASVKSYGGSIVVRSTQDRGSTVTVLLPAARDAAKVHSAAN